MLLIGLVQGRELVADLVLGNVSTARVDDIHDLQKTMTTRLIWTSQQQANAIKSNEHVGATVPVTRQDPHSFQD